MHSCPGSKENQNQIICCPLSSLCYTSCSFVVEYFFLPQRNTKVITKVHKGLMVEYLRPHSHFSISYDQVYIYSRVFLLCYFCFYFSDPLWLNIYFLPQRNTKVITKIHKGLMVEYLRLHSHFSISYDQVYIYSRVFPLCYFCFYLVILCG